VLAILALAIPSLALWEALERYPLGLTAVQRWAGSMALGPWLLAWVMWFASISRGYVDTTIPLAFLSLTLPFALYALRRLRWPKDIYVGSLSVGAAIVFGKLAHCQFAFEEGGFFAGSKTLLGDGTLHLIIINRFIQAQQDWNMNPIYSEKPLAYHYLVDLLSAGLCKMGTTTWSHSVVWPCAWLCLAGTLLLYEFARESIQSRNGAVLAVGFVLFSGTFNLHALRWGPVIEGFTGDPEHGAYFSNFVNGLLFPQRSTLLGWPIFLLVVVLMRRGGVRQVILSGLLASSLMLAHIPALQALLILALGHLLLSPGQREKWGQFLLLALLGALPLAWHFSGAQGGFLDSLSWQLGWLQPEYAGGENVITFWARQAGAVLLLLGMSFFLEKRGKRWDAFRAYLPVGSLFLVANLINFSPNPWDNCKLLHFWLLLSAPLLAKTAVTIWNERSKIVALLLITGAMLCGFLDVGRQAIYRPSRLILTDQAGIDLANYVARHTPQEALFAIVPIQLHPLPALTGRRVYVGYPRWLRTHGHVDLDDRLQNNASCLHGNTEALRQSGVDYVVLSDDGALLTRDLVRLAKFGPYTLYEVLKS
jgi:hypothetical protein